MDKFINPNTIINDKWIIGDREINKEEKEKILTFMDYYKIPHYLFVYREIGRRYAHNELDIDIK